MSTNEKEKHPLLIILGWITLVIGVMTLVVFVYKGESLQPSKRWLISLFFLLILLVVGLTLLYLGGDMKSLGISGGILGVASFLINIGIYTRLGITQMIESTLDRKFAGTITLFLLSYFIWLTLFHIAYAKATDSQSLLKLSSYRYKIVMFLFKLPSYGYALVTLFLIFGLVYKYVILGVDVDLGIIIETMIVAVGAGIFMYLHTQTKSDRTDA